MININTTKSETIEHIAGLIRQRDAEIKRLRATLKDLRERSIEEGIHHFVKLIDKALANE